MNFIRSFSLIKQKTQNNTNFLLRNIIFTILLTLGLSKLQPSFKDTFLVKASLDFRVVCKWNGYIFKVSLFDTKCVMTFLHKEVTSIAISKKFTFLYLYAHNEIIIQCNFRTEL